MRPPAGRRRHRRDRAPLRALTENRKSFRSRWAFSRVFTLTGSFDHSDINKKRLTNMSGKPRDNEGNREGATDLKEELNKKVKKTRSTWDAIAKNDGCAAATWARVGQEVVIRCYSLFVSLKWLFEVQRFPEAVTWTCHQVGDKVLIVCR